MKALVHVGLKPGVLDTQGEAVAQALDRMGFSEVRGARVSKVITLDLDGISDRETGESRIRDMCERLLANMVIESYRIEWAG
jgi:phosphoribosylformylglycinamidine synthase